MNEEYSSEFEAFHQARGRELYLYYSGQKERPGLDPIHERFSDLWSETLIRDLKAESERIPASSEAARRQAEFRLLFAVHHFLTQRLKPITDEIAQGEGHAAFPFEDAVISHRPLADELACEQSLCLRRDHFNRRLDVVRSLNDLRIERIALRREAIRKLGWERFGGHCQFVTHSGRQSLVEKFHGFLEDTAGYYRANLSDLLRQELNLPMNQAHQSDLTAILNRSPLDHHFQPEGLGDVYHSTFGDLGIATRGQRNIRLEVTQRQDRVAAAACFAVHVPNEIHIVILPSRGIVDYQELLHQSGRAQHLAFASPDLQAEFRFEGDPALIRMYGCLFEHLYCDRGWLERLIPAANPNSIARRSMLIRLLKLRRDAARLQFQCELEAVSDVSNLASRYESLLSEATGFHHEPDEYLVSIDESPDPASYLQACCFEAQLGECLRTKFGRRWWMRSKAGNLLKELWNTGLRYTAGEIADQAGIGPLGTDALIEEMRQEFARPHKA